MATITEFHPTDISSGIDQARSINLYQISLNNVTIELSSLGASITKILLPNYSHPELPRDDVVLSYANPQHQDQHRNSQFFGAIVGRVANRIKGGQFQLLQTLPSGDGDVKVLETYHLDKNNGPNHLHGGIDGFCHRVWKGEIIDGNTVKFSLDSPDGDQGYPAGIHVTATYSLESPDSIVNKNGASLCLKMQAHLIPGEVKATPIGLAQHSYFNLASHNSKERILKHSLKMPNCKKCTPLDSNSIPTRKLQPVGSDTGKAMDFRNEKLLADAIMQYGREKVGLPSENVAQMTSRILSTSNSDSESVYEVARVPKDGGTAGENLAGGSPYGFDHNYVIDKNNGEASSDKRNNLQIAAILSHEASGRSLCVSTTAPGIQLYTSNYLDGTNPPPALCKEGSRYHQWQGICLETQTYPDSIHPRSSNEDVLDDEFFEGRCFILKPGGENYLHVVRYDFGGIDQHG